MFANKHYKLGHSEGKTTKQTKLRKRAHTRNATMTLQNVRNTKSTLRWNEMGHRNAFFKHCFPWLCLLKIYNDLRTVVQRISTWIKYSLKCHSYSDSSINYKIKLKLHIHSICLGVKGMFFISMFWDRTCKCKQIYMDCSLKFNTHFFVFTFINVHARF